MSLTDWVTEAAEAVYMVVIINGYVAISQLNTQFLYIIAVDIGACLGWGFIDGFTYAIGNSIDRGKQADLIEEIDSKNNSSKAIDGIVEELDDTVLSGLSDEKKRTLAADFVENSPGIPPVQRGFFTRGDWAGLASIMGIYLSAGFVLSFPYLIFPNKLDAWFVSNTIGIIWLFTYGFKVAKFSGGKRILIGLLTASAGIVFLFLSYIVYA